MYQPNLYGAVFPQQSAPMPQLGSMNNGDSMGGTNTTSGGMGLGQINSMASLGKNGAHYGSMLYDYLFPQAGSYHPVDSSLTQTPTSWISDPGPFMEMGQMGEMGASGGELALGAEGAAAGGEAAGGIAGGMGTAAAGGAAAGAGASAGVTAAGTTGTALTMAEIMALMGAAAA